MKGPIHYRGRRRREEHTHTCIHIYIHTYIHTFIHTYIHTYIHTCKYLSSSTDFSMTPADDWVSNTKNQLIILSVHPSGHLFTSPVTSSDPCIHSLNPKTMYYSLYHSLVQLVHFKRIIQFHHYTHLFCFHLTHKQYRYFV